jgi:hypothetical protein
VCPQTRVLCSSAPVMITKIYVTACKDPTIRYAPPPMNVEALSSIEMDPIYFFSFSFSVSLWKILKTNCAQIGNCLWSVR